MYPTAYSLFLANRRARNIEDTSSQLASERVGTTGVCHSLWLDSKTSGICTAKSESTFRGTARESLVILFSDVTPHATMPLISDADSIQHWHLYLAELCPRRRRLSSSSSSVVVPTTKHTTYQDRTGCCSRGFRLRGCGWSRSLGATVI